MPIPRIFRLSFEKESNFAKHCYHRRFFAASAAIWFAGFAADPKLADDMEAQNRYNAACSAALAAAGKVRTDNASLSPEGLSSATASPP